MLNKLIKSSGKCKPKTQTYFSFAFHLRDIRDTFYKYEYEYTICVLHKAGAGFCK